MEGDFFSEHEVCGECLGTGRRVNEKAVADAARRLIKLLGRVEVMEGVGVEHRTHMSMLLAGTRRWSPEHVRRLIELRERVAVRGGLGS
jgi:hypothetical protein